MALCLLGFGRGRSFAGPEIASTNYAPFRMVTGAGTGGGGGGGGGSGGGGGTGAAVEVGAGAAVEVGAGAGGNSGAQDERGAKIRYEDFMRAMKQVRARHQTGSG